MKTVGDGASRFPLSGIGIHQIDILQLTDLFYMVADFSVKRFRFP